MVPPLPRWAWRWAVALPFAAGATNAIALMAFRHGGLTHLTGIATETAMAAVTSDVSVALHGVVIIVFFLSGCGMSAALTGPVRWRHASDQRLVLAIEAVVLGLAALFLPSRMTLALVLAAFAMGLQNGLSSVATGGLLRTTHLTGMLTDLGTAAGFHRHGTGVDRRRVRLSVLVSAMFVSGAISGALLDVHLGHGALGVPAFLVGVLALWPGRPSDATSGAIPDRVTGAHLSVLGRIRLETDALLDALRDGDLDEARFRVRRIRDEADAEGLTELAEAASTLRQHLAGGVHGRADVEDALARLTGLLAPPASQRGGAPGPARPPTQR